MVYIQYIRLEETIEDNQYQKLLQKVPIAIRQKVERFSFSRDAQMSLIGKLLLQKGLKRFNYSAEAVLETIQYTNYGRPYFSLPVDFNLSHSGEYVVCAITDRGKIGVDIEKIRAISLEGFNRHMTDSEWNRIQTSSNVEETFFTFWTQKEAVLKASGEGLNTSLQEVHLNGNSAIVRNKEWQLHNINIDPEYLCHWSIGDKQRNRDTLIEEVSLHSLF